jgi:hypothetical protein
VGRALAVLKLNPVARAIVAIDFVRVDALSSSLRLEQYRRFAVGKTLRNRAAIGSGTTTGDDCMRHAFVGETETSNQRVGGQIENPDFDYYFWYWKRSRRHCFGLRANKPGKLRTGDVWN